MTSRYGRLQRRFVLLYNRNAYSPIYVTHECCGACRRLFSLIWRFLYSNKDRRHHARLHDGHTYPLSMRRDILLNFRWMNENTFYRNRRVDIVMAIEWEMNINLPLEKNRRENNERDVQAISYSLVLKLTDESKRINTLHVDVSVSIGDFRHGINLKKERKSIKHVS
jgi:hypothetical protein